MMSEVGIECSREEFYLYEGMTGKATINLLFQRKYGRIAGEEEWRKLYEKKAEYFVEIGKIANLVKKVPNEWINEAGNDVTQEMIDYILPLIQGELPCTFNKGVPVHLRLY